LRRRAVCMHMRRERVSNGYSLWAAMRRRPCHSSRRKLQVHIAQIHTNVDTDGSHWQIEISTVPDNMSNVRRRSRAINRDGHFRLAIGKRILQLDLLYGKPVLLRTGMKVCRSSIGHSGRIIILHVVTVGNRNEMVRLSWLHRHWGSRGGHACGWCFGGWCGGVSLRSRSGSGM